MYSTSPQHIWYQNTTQNKKTPYREKEALTTLGNSTCPPVEGAEGPRLHMWSGASVSCVSHSLALWLPQCHTNVQRDLWSSSCVLLTANHIFLVLSQRNKDLLYHWMKTCGLEFTESSSPKWPLPKGLFKGKFDMKLFLPYMLTFAPNPFVRQTSVYLEWFSCVYIMAGSLIAESIFLSSGSRHKAVQ